MSLLRLLTAGRSLVGSKNPETRYHLSHPGALPKFGGKRNPFRATARPETAQSAALAPDRAGNEPAEPVVPMPVLAPVAESEVPSAVGGATATARATSAGVVAAVSPQAQGHGALARCAGKLKSLLVLRREHSPERAALRFAKPMVQAELLLERVRVVRNDLSDSDVEIVPVKPQAARAVEKRADGGWEKVAGRLFGAGKV